MYHIGLDTSEGFLINEGIFMNDSIGASVLALLGRRIAYMDAEVILILWVYLSIHGNQ